MPLLTEDDALPHRPWRVLVAGTSGAGKTTLAALIAEALQIPHIEIDSLYHGPGWVPRPDFESDVRSLAASSTWVTEWQYGQVRQVLAGRADLLVWLDLSRARVMSQVVGRTVGRWRRRQELWNGNVEPPLWTFFTDRNHIVRWAWSTHRKSATRVAALMRDRPDLAVVRLGSRRAVLRWCTGPLREAGRDG